MVMLLRELERIAAAASPRAPAGTGLQAVLATEPASGVRLYVCVFAPPEALEETSAANGSGLQRGATAWLVVDAEGAPVRSRRDVRDAVALAALCEVAADSAAGGDLDDLLSRLVALRLTEAPAGIDEAEAAVRALQRTLGSPPQLASPARLDAIGAAVRRLEQVLDPASSSPFAAAVGSAAGAIEALVGEVEASYLGPLD